MIEFVFRPSRIVDGKRAVSRLFSGRYALRGQQPSTVALGTPDKRVAERLLRDIVVEKQREQLGMVLPVAQRVAASQPITDLIGEYRDALRGAGRDLQHVQGTINRLYRMAREITWARLWDVRPDTFVKWFSHLDLAAKTKKEYQVSAQAFLNWLVKMERLERNPLVRLDRVETRGKQVRESRAMTLTELRSLIAVAGPRRLLYLTLLYSGLRRGEAASLLVADLHLSVEQPFFLLRASETKGKKKRVIPVHPYLLGELYPAVNKRPPNERVFPSMPRSSVLKNDLAKAGISSRDEAGRVLHFHSFRKTFQTLGVVAGINQRSAQELLGHSDPSLTASIYTDISGLDLYREVSKLPWLNSQVHSQNLVRLPEKNRFMDLLGELVTMAKRVVNPEDTENASEILMVDATGVEPVTPCV